MQQRLCLLSTAKRQPGPKHLPLCALGGSTSWPTGFSKLRSIRTRIIEWRARLILPEGDDGERIDPAVSLIWGRGSPRGIATGETEGPKAVNILVSRAVEAALLKREELRVQPLSAVAAVVALMGSASAQDVGPLAIAKQGYVFAVRTYIDPP